MRPLLILGLTGSVLSACSDGRLTGFTSESALASEPGAGGAASDLGTTADTSIATTDTGTATTDTGTATTASGPQVFTTLLIDDFEDGDTRVTPTSESWWYIFNDSTGHQEFLIEDVTGQRSSGIYAAHTYGERFTAWGAGLGVDLAGIQDARSPDQPFDASQFAGISFWAKVGASSVRETRVDLLSPCGDRCVSYSGANIQLATEWQQYTILFSELEPRQDESDFDQSQLMHIQFFFLDPESFDLWVDDLAVVSKYSVK